MTRAEKRLADKKEKLSNAAMEAKWRAEKRAKAPAFAIDELRSMRRMFDSCLETFNKQDHNGKPRTLEDLIAIGRAFWLSAYDILPDRWTPRMVRAALRGEPVDSVMPLEMKR